MQVGVSAISRTPGLHHMEHFLGKKNDITLNIPPPFFPPLYMLCGTIWNGISAGVSCPSCLPSQLLVHPWPTCNKKQRRAWLCVSTAQQSQKHPRIINAVFSTNLKHSPTPATIKKINSIPAKHTQSGSKVLANERHGNYPKETPLK